MSVMREMLQKYLMNEQINEIGLNFKVSPVSFRTNPELGQDALKELQPGLLDSIPSLPCCISIPALSPLVIPQVPSDSLSQSPSLNLLPCLLLSTGPLDSGVFLTLAREGTFPS